MFWCEVWYLKITMSRPYCANASGNYDVTHGGHISEDFIGLARHSSSTQWGFLTSRRYHVKRPPMLLPIGRSILSLDGLHQWSADLSWWVQTKAIRRTYGLGANQSSYHYGLVYSTRLGNLRGRISRICDSPPLPPTYVLLASIVLLCFIEYTLKAVTPTYGLNLTFAATGDGLFYRISWQVSRHHTCGTIDVQNNMDMCVPFLTAFWIHFFWNLYKHRTYWVLWLWAQGPPFSKIGSKMARIQHFRDFLLDLFINIHFEPTYQK